MILRGIRGGIETIQTTVLMRSARVLRRVLKNYCHPNFNEIPPASASVKKKNVTSEIIIVIRLIVESSQRIKKTVESEGDGDAKSMGKMAPKSSGKKLGKKAREKNPGGIGNQRKTRSHPDHNTVEISFDTQKSGRSGVKNSLRVT